MRNTPRLAPRRIALLGAAAAAAAAAAAMAPGTVRAAEQFFSPNDFAIAIDATANYYIDNTGTGGTFSMYPNNEPPLGCVDGSTASKYLSFGRQGSGFIAIPGGSNVVQSFQISTANDAIGRDPTKYVLLGTNDPVASTDRSNGLGESWTLVQQGALALPDARQTAGPVVNLTNATGYTAYKMYFPDIKNAAGNNSMQISEVQFYTAPDAGGTALFNPVTDIRAIDNPQAESSYNSTEAPKFCLDQDSGTKYLNLMQGAAGNDRNHGAGLIVTPKRGPSIVQSFQLTTANDSETRDPTGYEVYGTNSTIVSAEHGSGNEGETWTLIGSGALTLPVARQTAGAVISLTNSTAYSSYKIVFTDTKGSSNMQIGDIAFVGDLTGQTEWITDASGSWLSGFNWFGPTPNAVDATARFLDKSTSAHTVFADGPVTLGTLRIENTPTYHITGAGNLTMQVSTGAASINVSGGVHTLNLPLTIASNTTINVNGGATLKISDPVTVNAGQAITQTGAGAVLYESTVDVLTGGGFQMSSRSAMSRLSLGDGATATLSLGGSGAVHIDSLAMSASARFDMIDNALVTGTGKAAVEALVRSGRNSGTWDAPGITSSAARTRVGTGLGVLSGAEYNAFGGTGDFQGQSYSASDTLVKHAWNGDTNFSGAVDFDDYARTDAGFNTGLTGWANGDFNYSGSVNFDDYVLIDVAFNAQSGTLGRAVNYLDGTDRSTTGLDDAGLAEVLQHFDQFGLPYASAFLAAVPEPAAGLSAVVCVVGVAVSSRRRRGTKR